MAMAKMKELYCPWFFQKIIEVKHLVTRSQSFSLRQQAEKAINNDDGSAEEWDAN